MMHYPGMSGFGLFETREQKIRRLTEEAMLLAGEVEAARARALAAKSDASWEDADDALLRAEAALEAAQRRLAEASSAAPSPVPLYVLGAALGAVLLMRSRR
jgi:hypothetical protein